MADLPSARPAGSTPLLQLRGVGFWYPEATSDHATAPAALRDVTLSLAAGDAVAVLGPQGSGTSTLCRAAAGLLAEHGRLTGSVTVCDAALPAQEPARLSGAAPVALLGDDPEAQLTGMASVVLDEIQLPGRLTGLPLTECADRAQQVMDLLGIAELAGRRVEELSGGERQLTALASLLTLDPAVLILDQPSLSLDAAARARLLNALRQHCTAGGAVLIAAHQWDEVTAFCPRTLFLEAGSLQNASLTNTEKRDDDVARLLSPAAVDDARTAADRSSHNAGSPTRAARGVWDTTGAAASPTIAEVPVSGPSSAPGWSPLLQTRGLTVVRGGSTVLNGVDLSLIPGSITGALGPNGAGKSTLLRAVAGLLPNRTSGAGATTVSGTVLGPDGVDLTDLPAYQRAGHLAWVGQDPGVQLSASTVEKELRQTRRGEGRRRRAPSADEVAEVLGRTGLSEHAQTHPYDLTPAQRKDVVIAAALLLQPRVLLLDEPTLGRDGPSMERLTRLLRGLAHAGCAVLLTTHDHRWAQMLCETLITLTKTPRTS
ncbi:ATP-binding cassette domain-containing protein [Nesterenkonia flava]|uniref:ATP-binding cassette domain-containing protein n=1 Tax=Nesterenkonia flava TaxID=469799 RepID=A0ABU1FU85_9MICC|nr:ATP-binding cassette domain-containing protein [Nesterenkonia flava]MDR5712178.1 ATP-binding cassette domain-containing protein [Nesterenkonia flava]